MAEYRATIEWKIGDSPDFLRGKFTREHTWAFDGGIVLEASASPSVVPAPWSNIAHIDPEEAFVAAISSCQMLTFLFVASKAGFIVETYRDAALGVMTKNERGVMWVSKVTLAPQISYRDKRPTAEEEEHLHDAAHDGCYIANSVKTEIVVTPQR